MNLLQHSPRILVLALLGIALPPLAQAAPVSQTFTGQFGADNSVFSDPFTLTSLTNVTFVTNSYASGGIVPVLSLFNSTTGGIIDYSGVNTGFGDVSLMDTLDSGSYVLDLTEFPNVAIGDLSAGFLNNLFPDAATFTGDSCGVSGGKFYNTITCTPTTPNYSVTSSLSPAAATVTPEPATWMLLLAPGGMLMRYCRRSRQA